MKPVTPNLIEQAKLLRRNHLSWRSIAMRLDVSEWHIHCAVEPHFREFRRNCVRNPPKDKRVTVNSSVGHEVRYRNHQPPAEVLREAELALELRLKPRSPTAELLGDPLPGRSALDQRQRKG
jgi:hypothetical protein